MKLAIDFGTTNTVIARWDNGVQLVSLPGLSTTLDGVPSAIPSLVYVHDGQTGNVSVGMTVREQQLDSQHDNRLFRNFKRGIVSPSSPEPRMIDGTPWTDRDASETFMRTLLNSLQREQIDQLVLTAPVVAFESYLTWLSDIAGNLASEHIYMVDKSTAAALGYAVTKSGSAVLVLDFGGGTLDLSLVQLPESRETTGGILSRLRLGGASRNTARVIAKAGRVMGGSDIDQWLLAWALEQVNQTPADLGGNYTTLLTNCEQAKIRLSLDKETILPVDILWTDSLSLAQTC